MKMNVAYVLEDAGPSGGARVVLEHCTRLARRGHGVTLFTVTQSDPSRWFDTRGVKHKPTGSYAALEKALRFFDGIKVATWWKTAMPVACTGGIGLYLVQDYEISYLPNPDDHGPVLDTYQLPLTQITESRWVANTLGNAKYIGIGIDHNVYRRTEERRDNNVILYNWRGHYLKGPDLFLGAMRLFPKKTMVVTFGSDRPPAKDVIHKGFLTDKEVARLYNMSGVYVSTSAHEGFGLPCLEAMACGCPVIATNSDGNMEFCVHGLNCLIADRNPESVASAVSRIMADRALADRLVAEGLETAQRYRWGRVIDRLEDVFRSAIEEFED